MNLSDFGDGESWKEMWARSQTVPQRISLNLSLIHKTDDPYNTFVDLIDEAIAHISFQMARSKNVLKGMGEDQLTNNIIAYLHGMGFLAQFEANNGGNCDISIQGADDMVWLGEAKIYRSGKNLLSGLQQLVDRYATGLPSQDRGSLIIYILVKNAAKVMRTWNSRLVLKMTKGVVLSPPGKDLTFHTNIEHAGSGRNLLIKHVPVVLFHEPTEIGPAPDWNSGGPLNLGAHRTRQATPDDTSSETSKRVPIG